MSTGFLSAGCIVALQTKEVFMNKLSKSFAALVVTAVTMTSMALMSQPAQAWDEVGHMVVARIAWQNMTPKAKRISVALLSSAPQDSGLPALLPEDARARAVREISFFLRASTWPDIVKDPHQKARLQKYHHGNWHYTNFFWDHGGPGLTPRERTDMAPEATNVVERLTALTGDLQNRNVDASERGIALAWVVHLMGDIHNPLHTSARVTFMDPRGDQGGNLFKLMPSSSNSLHSYWDNILDISVRRERGESVDNYINRAAALSMTRHPRAALATRADKIEFTNWAREGLLLSQTRVYPTTLQRGARPTESYRRMAFNTSAEQMALAGYRLANVLNTALAGY
jgi:hypothetical protein